MWTKFAGYCPCLPLEGGGKLGLTEGVGVAMCQQIRTVSHDRLEKLVSTLKDVDLRDEIREALRQYF